MTGIRLKRSFAEMSGLAWRSRTSICFSLADQGCFSGANFVVNVLLVRWSTRAEYGAFAVAFAWFLVAAGIHTALVNEPLSVLGPARYALSPIAYSRKIFTLHWIVSCGLGCVIALSSLLVHDRQLRGAMFALGLWTPALLSYWVMRRIQYFRNAPRDAALSSSLYLVLVTLALIGLKRHGALDPETALASMAGASLVTTALGWVRMIGAKRESGPLGTTAARLIAEHLRFGRSIAAGSALTSFTSQLQLTVAAAVLGLGVAGSLRALTNLIQPMVQIMSAIGTAALPKMARANASGGDRELRRLGVNVFGAMIAGSAGYAIVLAAAGRPVVRLLYGSGFEHLETTVALLGLAPLCIALGEGYSLMLRAAQLPIHKLWAAVAALAVGGGTAVPFMTRWGLTGAVWSSLVMYVSMWAATYVFYWRWVGSRPSDNRASAVTPCAESAPDPWQPTA
ncbi:MAG TPA: hypothetical protein VHW09_02355 [Bryobacteraceae bacterium]|nr:hypothetical protein [Bryobacteraceae bacterium]